VSAPGFITEGEIGNTAAEAQGTDLIPSTGGEVAAATFGRALAMNPTSRLYRLIDRNTAPNPRTMQPDELNEMFGVPGKLSFSEPTTMEVARDLHDYHRAQAIREDTIRRSGGGVGSGMAASFGINVAATLLDPLNVASAFIPFVGEANLAARFGGAAAGALGRLGVRAAEGAGQGFLGAAALEPANYWLSRQDRDDYTMGDAMLNLAFGTVAGSFLHGGLGVLRDARRGLPDWAPESNAAAIRQATAAIAEGRPVMAAEAAEFTAARRAREDLEDWYGRLRTQDERVAAAEASVETRGVALTEVQDTLRTLRAEADQLSRERQAAEIQGTIRGLHHAQRVEFRDIEAKLADPATPMAERMELEIRRLDLLDEASSNGTRPNQELEAARDAAQAEGLGRVEAGLRSKIAQTERRFWDAARRAQAADQALRRERSILASKEAVTLAMAEKTVRRLAFQTGIVLEPGEAAAMASRFLHGAARNADDAAKQLQADMLSAGARGTPAVVDGVEIRPDIEIMARTLRGLTEREMQAENALRDGLRVTEDAADIRATRANEAQIAEAPKLDTGNLADEITDAQDAVKRLEDALAAEERAAAAQAKAEGREPPAPDRGVEYADELRKAADSDAKAYEAAAMCAIGRL